MSALCIGPCRPAEHGGPRQAGKGGRLCDVCAERFAGHLRGIASWWPDLLDRLARESSDAMSEKVRGTRSVGLVLNEKVSDGMRETASWLMFVARLVMDERDVHPPVDQSPAAVASWLADWHAPWLTTHHDEQLVMALSHEAAQHEATCRRLAFPSGARKVELPLRCTEYADTDTGERVRCEGTMHAWVAAGRNTLPDLVCSLDETHRVDPATWSRPTFRKRFDANASAEFVRALLAQPTGT